jgi:hypothetical protein
MKTILIVIPFCANDAILAEHLCDLIFLHNKRVKKGACLLVISQDCHPELWEKTKIAAEVAFETVDITYVPNIATGNKNQHINKMFTVAAELVSSNYRCPWVWLEPDATPVQSDWIEKFESAYEGQVKRYLGPWLKNQENGEVYLGRIAVYPPDAIEDIKGFLNSPKVHNIAAGDTIKQRSTKSYLVQEVAIVDENTKVSENAVVVHPDKNSILKAKMRDELDAAPKKKR